MKPIIDDNCFVIPPMTGPIEEHSARTGKPFVSSPTPARATVLLFRAKDSEITEDPYLENDNAD